MGFRMEVMSRKYSILSANRRSDDTLTQGGFKPVRKLTMGFEASGPMTM